LRRGTECDFRASMPCNVERASSAGLAGFGPEGPGWRVPAGRRMRFSLAGAAGHGMRFPRVDAMQRGAGRQRRVGRVRTGRHGWRVRRGAECDFRASMPCNVERASSAGLAGSGPDGSAASCGWARNANFVQGPYDAGRGPDGAGVVRGGPDDSAAGCGWVRNAIFVQRPYEAGDGPRGAGVVGDGPDDSAAGGDRVRNANFVQRPYEPRDGPVGRSAIRQAWRVETRPTPARPAAGG
jgi:hypothetical protein